MSSSATVQRIAPSATARRVCEFGPAAIVYLSFANFEAWINEQGYTEAEIEAKIYNLGYTDSGAANLEADLSAGNVISQAAFAAAASTV